VANLKSKKESSGEALLYAWAARECGRIESGRGAAWRRTREDACRGSGLPDRQPHIFAVVTSLGFQSRLVSMEQAASPPPERLAFRRTQPRRISLRHLHHPRNSFIGKTEEQLTDEGVALRSGYGFFPRKIARGQIRGETTVAENSLRSLHQALFGCSHHWRRSFELLHIGQAVFALKARWNIS